MPGAGHSIQGNTVISTTSKNAGIGIRVRDVGGILVCDNTTNEQETGFLFQGNCPKTTFSINTIGAHNNGLEIGPSNSSSGFIGSQERRNNTWSATQSDYVNLAALNTQNPLLSKFETQNSLPSILPPKRDPIGTSWMEQKSGDLDECPIPDDGMLAGAYDSIVKGIILDTAMTNATLWEMKRAIIYELMRFPSIKSSNTFANSFYNNSTDSTYFKYAEIDYDLFINLAPSSTVQNKLDVAYSKKKSFLDLMSTASNRLSLGSDSSSIDSTIFIDKQIYLDSIKYYDSIKIKNLLDYKSVQQTTLSNAIANNNAITATSDYEISQQDMNDIKFRHLKTDTMTNADSIAVYTLAYECQNSHGTAVLQAQMFLPLCVRIDIADPVCPRSSFAQNQEKEEKQSINKIYPNPTNADNFYFESEANLVEIIIFNMNGILIHKETFGPSKSGYISTKSMENSGLYQIVGINQKGQTVGLGKLNFISY